jgi:hypothetical protein
MKIFSKIFTRIFTIFCNFQIILKAIEIEATGIYGVQIFFNLPWLLWSAQYRIFLFRTVHYSISVSPFPSNLGRQVCTASYISMNVCLQFTHGSRVITLLVPCLLSGFGLGVELGESLN